MIWPVRWAINNIARTMTASKTFAATILVGLVYLPDAYAAKWSAETCDAVLVIKNTIVTTPKISDDPAYLRFEKFNKAQQVLPILNALATMCGINTRAELIRASKTINSFIIAINPNPTPLEAKLPANMGVPVDPPSPPVATFVGPLPAGIAFPPPDLSKPVHELVLAPAPRKQPSFNCITMNEVFGNGSTTHCNPD